MARSSRGRSTTGEAAVPYYRGTVTQEAAKHLRLTCTRYLADRASFADIERAMDEMRSAPLADIEAAPRAKETKQS